MDDSHTKQTFYCVIVKCFSETTFLANDEIEKLN